MKTRAGKSNIHGAGLFANDNIDRSEGFIGITHIDNSPTEDIGALYNHSENPNARVTKIGSRHYIAPIDKISANEEITVDYRKQPELEQPQEGWKCGGKIEGHASRKK